MAVQVTDVSIDLETVSHKFNAGILSIGAVAFHRKTGKLGPEFYAPVKLVDTLCYGHCSASTLQWWMSQGKQAQAVFDAPTGMPLYEALRGLNDFLRNLPSGTCVWGNGASFDITVLEYAFHAVDVKGFEANWAETFWDIRDLRTLMDVSELNKGVVPFEGTAHNALHDARHQAKLAIAAFAKIKAEKHEPEPPEEEDW